MSWRSQLIIRLSVLLTAGVMPVGCSDPYQHGAGVNTSATSSAPSATTAATGAGASTPSGASSATTTPDLGEFTGAAPSSADLQAAAQAARAFVGPYLLYTYGQAQASQIPAADPTLIAQLVANPPSVPPSVHSRHPKVTSLSVSGGGAGQVAFQAYVSDGAVTYGVPLTVTREQNRWLVTSVQ
jgi:hypothetical protein